MQRESNLWWYVDETLTQQQSNGFTGVTEDLFQLFCQTVGSIFLTLVNDQLLDLLHTLHTLQKTTTKCIKLDKLQLCGDDSQLVHLRYYLSLREVEHSDEAKHFVWIIVIAVLWHIGLLGEN